LIQAIHVIIFKLWTEHAVEVSFKKVKGHSWLHSVKQTHPSQATYQSYGQAGQSKGWPYLCGTNTSPTNVY
jgi:hypothetical protein